MELADSRTKITSHRLLISIQGSPFCGFSCFFVALLLWLRLRPAGFSVANRLFDPPRPAGAATVAAVSARPPYLPPSVQSVQSVAGCSGCSIPAHPEGSPYLPPIRVIRSWLFQLFGCPIPAVSARPPCRSDPLSVLLSIHFLLFMHVFVPTHCPHTS